jgi:type II secretory pathway component PulF
MAKRPLKPLSSEELTEFLNQLLQCHRIHMSVEQGLDVIAQTTSHKNLKAATLRTKEIYVADCKKSLAQAMNSCGVFGKLAVASVRFGESSGQMQAAVEPMVRNAIKKVSNLRVDWKLVAAGAAGVLAGHFLAKRR